MKITWPHQFINLPYKQNRISLTINRSNESPISGITAGLKRLVLTRDRLDLTRGLNVNTKRDNKTLNGMQDFVTVFQTFDKGLQDINSQLMVLREQAVKASEGSSDSETMDGSEEVKKLMVEIDQIAASTWDKTRDSVTEAVLTETEKPTSATEKFVIDLGQGEGGKLEVYGVNNLSSGDARTGRLIVIQSGPNEGQTHSLDMGLSDCSYLGLGAVDLTTRESAGHSITIIDKAIDGVSRQRAGIGATINVLEHRINYLNTMATNLTEAESRIRDADIAKEYSEYVTYQLRMKFAILAMGLAQKAPQTMLELLEMPPGYTKNKMI